MIPMQPIPVDSLLVPDQQPAVPDGFTSARQGLTNGLPFTWSIASDLSLVLLASVGDAGVWRAADPATIASTSADEVAPHVPPRGADPREQLALRLVVRKAKATIAAVPLAAGLVRIAPDGDGAASVLELYIVGWTIHAGCVRGAGDYGSYIDVGWRRANVAATSFDPGAYSLRRRGGYLP